MRPYRGLTKDGKWVYGWYQHTNPSLPSKEKHYIIDCCGVTGTALVLAHTLSDLPSYHEVIPETVGQQVGLKDKSGTEIYEGDIVKLLIDRAHYTGEKDKYRQEIVTKGCSCGLNTNGMISIQKEGQEEYEPQLEIIGNIHQHPNLMEQDNG